MKRLSSAVIAIIGLQLLVSVGFSQNPTLTWLGTLGGSYSCAFGVSSNGQVVVGIAQKGDKIYRAFRWTPSEGIQDLGTFGGDKSVAHGVSADGRVIVGWARNAQGANRAFRWTQETGMIDLGTLPGHYHSEAYGISANGLVIVGQSRTQTGWTRSSFRWTQSGGMERLRVFTYGSLAHETSSDGSVVVGWYQPFPYHAYRWTRDRGAMDLGTLGGYSSEALYVSWDGSVVVGVAENRTDLRAFRWTQATGMVDLGTLGGRYSAAYTVTGDGSMVFGISQRADKKESVFRWTATGGMEDLNEVYGNLLVDGSRLMVPHGVSGDGRFIVGVGYNGTTKRYEAFLLDTRGSGPFSSPPGQGSGQKLQH